MHPSRPPAGERQPTAAGGGEREESRGRTLMKRLRAWISAALSAAALAEGGDPDGARALVRPRGRRRA
jgi:hypothetical protein